MKFYYLILCLILVFILGWNTKHTFVKAEKFLYLPDTVNGKNRMYIEDKCLIFGSNLKDIRNCRYDYENSNVYCELYKKGNHFQLTIPVFLKEGDLTEIDDHYVRTMDLVTGILDETENKGVYQMRDIQTNLLAWVGCGRLKDGSVLNLDGNYSISKFILKLNDSRSIVIQFEHVLVKRI